MKNEPWMALLERRAQAERAVPRFRLEPAVDEIEQRGRQPHRQLPPPEAEIELRRPSPRCSTSGSAPAATSTTSTSSSTSPWSEGAEIADGRSGRSARLRDCDELPDRAGQDAPVTTHFEVQGNGNLDTDLTASVAAREFGDDVIDQRRQRDVLERHRARLGEHCRHRQRILGRRQQLDAARPDMPDVFLVARVADRPEHFLLIASEKPITALRGVRISWLMLASRSTHWPTAPAALRSSGRTLAQPSGPRLGPVSVQA